MGDEVGKVKPQAERELAFKNSQLRKTCGKQGQTIYRLRAELAEVRESSSKLERGELRRLERVVMDQQHLIATLYEKLNEGLVEDIPAAEEPMAAQAVEA